MQDPLMLFKQVCAQFYSEFHSITVKGCIDPSKLRHKKFADSYLIHPWRSPIVFASNVLDLKSDILISEGHKDMKL